MARISDMVKKSGLSRSTLLYYDSIGLLSPSSRSRAGYRFYSSDDIEKLEKILSLRKTGLPLEEIKKIISGSSDALTGILKKRLIMIGQEIAHLKEQRKIILAFLNDNITFEQLDDMNKKQFVEILEASGMTSLEMDRFHKEFEKKAPQLHRDFLEFLGISKKEIAEIVALSKASND